jgi:hypothetical protein
MRFEGATGSFVLTDAHLGEITVYAIGCPEGGEKVAQPQWYYVCKSLCSVTIFSVALFSGFFVFMSMYDNT